MLKNFVLDEQYMCEQQIVEHKPFFQGKSHSDLTPEQLFYVITHEPPKMIYSKDHEEFTKFRMMLSALGYVKVELGWHNGDQVLKSFKLNGFILKKGAKFYCAPAMKNAMQFARYRNLNHIV